MRPTCSGPGCPAPEVTFDPADAPRRAAVQLGHDGQPQGRDAHPPQPRGQRRADPAACRTCVADDRVLAVLPFFHIYGMTVLLNAALHARARLVIMPSFDLVEFLGNIAEPRVHVRVHRAAGRRRAGQAPARRAVTTCPALQTDHVGRRTAGRGPRPRSRDAPRLPRGAGLRHERTQPGQPRHAVRRRPDSSDRPRRSSSLRLDGAQRGQQARRPRDRRRDRPSPRGSQRARRAVVQGPQRDGRLPRQRRGDRARPSTPTASCTPATSPASTPTAASTSSTGSRSSSSTRATRCRPPSSRRVLLTHPADRRRRRHRRHRRRQARRCRRRSWSSNPDAELTEDEVMAFVAEQVAPYKKVRQVGVHRRDPEVGLRQDPAQGPARDT